MLVPRVSDLASAGEIRAWNEAEIKQYKIRVIRPKDADMNKLCHPSSDKTWKDLNNEPVTFKGTSAPEQGTFTTRIVQPCCVELIISSHGTRPCKTRWARKRARKAEARSASVALPFIETSKPPQTLQPVRYSHHCNQTSANALRQLPLSELRRWLQGRSTFWRLWKQRLQSLGSGSMQC